jgi:trans-aconitate methyltransferase
MIVLELTLIGLTLAVALSITWGTFRTGISPMPSSRRARKAMLMRLPHDLNGPVYDLGSGWGGLAIALARAHPRATVIGYEISRVPLLTARLFARLRGVPNVRFEREDFFDVSLADAVGVVTYLFPDGMAKLCMKLEDELAVGTPVISNTFRVPGWTPEKMVTMRDLHRTRIYRYRAPGPDQT